MTKRMLIDASHAEETRVVVLDGNRLEDFDVETQSRRQLKGNIYLAKVVRVEPSLQAAFVEYGGNRHGFLAFGEIHPDYYQIPIADRQRLLQMQEEEARAEEEAEEAEDRPEAAQPLAPEAAQPLAIDDQPLHGPAEEQPEDQPEAAEPAEPPLGVDAAPEAAEPATQDAEPAPAGDEAVSEPTTETETHIEAPSGEPATGTRVRQVRDEGTAPEAMGGESEQGEERQASRSAARFMRSYKIQEVIRRRQILLIQVVKEERGTKGAALTTYISLAGRYCVLMPNSPRGGGISRKITSAADRRRLKEVTAELDIPRGMGLIVRTAGAMRPKPEIRRDGEYLLRLWDDIREQTMQSMAPSLIYEEATLIKRAIRDVYSRDVDELLIDGEDGWRAARDFMRMLMPAHVKKVQLWPQGGQPLFAHSQVESMLDAMLNPTVQLKSGGYLVINQTEALVAIDVNSGRSTRERGIEETALRTNLEAAEEAARQLRLRDLAGLIVIDFIDMESKKHNAMVERRMAESLKNDRARIQVGHISHFGLMELSRQRLRPSLAETSLTICEHCGGSGHVRSTESASLHVLREIEEEGGKQRAAEIMVHVAPTTALYILNNKRQRLAEIEQRYRMVVCFAADETLHPAQTRIDRVRAQTVQEFLPPPVIQAVEHDEPELDAEFEEDAPAEEATPRNASAASPRAADPDAVPGETAEEGEQRRRRRRRRRRGGRRDETGVAQESPPLPLDAEQPDVGPIALPEHVIENAPEPLADDAALAISGEIAEASPVPGHDEATEAAVEAEQTPAKRGRRGGRRRRKPGAEGGTDTATGEEAPTPVQAPLPYSGPTPANPFAMDPFDIFDVMDSLDRHPEEAVVASAPQPVEAPAAEAAEPAPVPATIEPEPAAFVPEPELALALVEPPVSAPAIQPVLIGATDPAADKKKGWWRR